MAGGDEGWLQPIRGSAAEQAKHLLDIFATLCSKKAFQDDSRTLITRLFRSDSADISTRMAEVSEKVKTGAFTSYGYDQAMMGILRSEKGRLAMSKDKEAYVSLIAWHQHLTAHDGRLPSPAEGLKVPEQNRTYIDTVKIKGDILRSGDFVHLFAKSHPAVCTVACIRAFFTLPDTGPKIYVDTRWCYKPENTTHYSSRKFFRNEVFFSEVLVAGELEDYIEKCCVMHVSDYIRGRPKAPQWNHNMEDKTYPLKYLYEIDTHEFTKISKSDWFGWLHDPVIPLPKPADITEDLDLFPSKRPLEMVPSPFAELAPPKEKKRKRKTNNSLGMSDEIYNLDEEEESVEPVVVKKLKKGEKAKKGGRPPNIKITAAVDDSMFDQDNETTVEDFSGVISSPDTASVSIASASTRSNHGRQRKSCRACSVAAKEGLKWNALCPSCYQVFESFFAIIPVRRGQSVSALQGFQAIDQSVYVTGNKS